MDDVMVSELCELSYDAADRECECCMAGVFVSELCEVLYDAAGREHELCVQ